MDYKVEEEGDLVNYIFKEKLKFVQEIISYYSNIQFNDNN